MNRTIGSFLIALSTAAVFAGCADDPDAASTAAAPDGIGTVTTARGAPVVASAAWAQAIGAPATPGLAAAYALASSNAAALVASRPAFLHASPNDAFVQRGMESSSGLVYVPYERTYAGLPVVGGDFVMVIDGAGQLVYHSVAQERSIDLLSITPTLSQAAAETIATQRLLSVTRMEGTQLVVNALGPTARLAWETTVNGFGANGISRLTVDVDAITGAVLREQEHVMYGTGTSAWNGPNPVTINTSGSGGTFSMKDPTIINLSCQDAANNTTFSKSTNVWGNTDKTNRETGCVDALFGAQTEARMLTTWLGRNGFDGVGGGWPIRVGLADVNVFYDGTQVQVGHNNANQWIAALDVICHELGHGIDDHTPGGISGGGTQEFVADTFGAATEAFANEPAPFDVPDFTVGEQINLVGTGPFRNMANPSLVSNNPNCFSTAIPNTEIHAAAGPGNHWFYLLAQGSNPTNGFPTSPTCNNTTVTGLGTQTAIKIMYNAMLMKTTGMSYPKYRSLTLQAAINLFPGSCTQYNTVKAAWDAVSVPVQAGDPISGMFTPSTDVPKSIPDNNATGVTSVLQVSGNGTVGSLSLSLNITHTFPGDLVVTLIAPDSKSFIVSDRAGGAAANIIINNQAITAFNGHTAAGTWQLKVQDLAAVDVGTINSWSLAISPIDFGIASTPMSRTLVAGTSVTYMINTDVSCGAAQTIALSVSGLPAGVTGSFSPASVLAGGNATLTLTAAANAGATTKSFTITGTGTTATHTINASVTVPPNDFSITPNPTSQTVAASASTMYTINTAVVSGAAQTITLSVSDLPAGVTGSFSPASVLTGGTSTLTLTADANAGATTKSFTITGTGTTATHTINASVTVPPNDFSITPNPTLRTVAPGASTMYTINTAVVSGAAQTITLSVLGLPTGVTGNFSPASVTAGGSSTLTLTAAANADATTTSFTITGTGTTATHTVSASVTVPPNDFSITPTPTSQTVTKITGAAYTINTAVTVGVSQAIALSVSGLPSGVTGSFSPTTVTAGGSSTLTLTATAAAVPGTTAAFTITGTGTSITETGTSVTHMVNASVTVENPPHWSVSGTPNLTINDNGSACTELSVATTGGDSSLAKLDISGHHTNRPMLRGTLEHNEDGNIVKAFPVSTFDAGDGMFSFSSRSVDGLSGDASGRWQLCIIDTDAFGDTGTLISWSIHN